MGRFYDVSAGPEGLRRRYDVYDRLTECGIELETFEDNVQTAEACNIAGVVFHESTFVYLSGSSMGSFPMNASSEKSLEGSVE